VRTQEQIKTQLEARYRELQAEAKSAKINKPCETCRWMVTRDGDGMGPYVCIEPLVHGFKKRREAYRIAGVNRERSTFDSIPPLCGTEKALWQPRRNIFQWLWDWFTEPWRNGQ
jgi:hypothetical protein